MKAYKGFKSDMTCRGFQYEEGNTYTTTEAELCVSGFHACLMPIDVLRYYDVYNSKFHVVELDGNIDSNYIGDTKVAATEITIGDSLTFGDLMYQQLGFAFNMDIANNDDYVVISNTNQYGFACNDTLHSLVKKNIAVSKGDNGIAATCGHISIKASANSWGYNSIAANTLSNSSCLAIGFSAIASSTGESNVVVTHGCESISAGTQRDTDVISNGTNSVSVSTGSCSDSLSLGEDSISVANGSYNKVRAFGHGSIAVSNGDSNMVFVGENCTGVIKGEFSCGAGELGSCLIFIYEDEKGRSKTKTIHITGKKYKPNVWYCINKDNEADVKTVVVKEFETGIQA